MARPVVLCILDGWGHREAPDQNAIAQAHTPHWDRFLATYPHGLIEASELHVGLPTGQMGNSEVGHMNLGAGRVVMQELPRIDAAIADGSLAQHAAIQTTLQALKASGKALHVMGLLSDGGVHAHLDHIVALVKMAAQAGVRVWVHAFLDGRDTPPKSALGYVEALEKTLAEFPQARIATISGRYFAMDRDKRWERVQLAYAAMVNAEGPVHTSATQAIEAAYQDGKTDEFVTPCVLPEYKGVEDGDALLMANFRADRAREMLSALLEESFTAFAVRPVAWSAKLGMVEYSSVLAKHMTTLFPPQSLVNGLGEVVAKAGLAQLRIAETEKYAHVTFFFNGGREEPWPKESRILVPSPQVATYDLQPEMSAAELTDKLIDAIESEAFDLIVVNYANTDMVGHSGILDAARRAVEAVDECLGRLEAAILKVGGKMLVTADHGNAEQMYDEQTQQSHTAHTLNPVPCLLIGNAFAQSDEVRLRHGVLADIAPTILELMGLPQPAEMTGRSLWEKA